ncbi:hypothetical protein PAXRUDRAFT_138363 [Paxillus rubicundulus Ve08.2h10]|uniref:Uncharacterized protein n=1 Tax=Paxillus rubicundulus Ve08.2h10 TaxID=930991 RepID=A0A0D0E033_9AGAM|nr:hypothetical protein PAXRUDRAFT_138363 [Paxillus rubicundulus Ve08.2h10]
MANAALQDEAGQLFPPEIQQLYLWTGSYCQFTPLKAKKSPQNRVSCKMLLIHVPGHMVHPLNLHIEPTSYLLPSQQPQKLTETWTIPGSDLASVIDVLWELTRLNQATSSVPKCGVKTHRFPYHKCDRSQVFVVEATTRELQSSSCCNNPDKTIDCTICGKAVKHKLLHSHTGGHILRAQMGIKEDHLVTQVTVGNPCGFCGQSSHPVRLTKEGKKCTFQPSSSCPLTITFSLGAAATSTKNSPSTNVPIYCSICPATSGDHAVVWKYNMAHHLGTMHAEWHPTQLLPADLITAMKITHFEQEHLGIPGELISLADSNEEEAETGEGTSSTLARTKRKVRGPALGQCQSKQERCPA